MNESELKQLVESNARAIQANADNVQRNSEAIDRLTRSLDALSEDVASTNAKVDRLADIVQGNYSG